MNESLLHRFIELIKHDQQINSLEREIDKLQEEVVHDEQDIQVFQDHLDAAERYKRDLHKLVDEKELHMRELNDREHELKRRLTAITSNREYESLQKELSTLQKEQMEFEKELLDAWKRYEDVQRSSLEKKEYTSEKNEKLNAIIVAKMQKIQELEEKQKVLEAERESKTHDIAPEMLEKYSLMRQQISNPVVPLDRGSCTGCFSTIPEQEKMSIERGALKQCRMCFRFLYSEQYHGTKAF